MLLPLHHYAGALTDSSVSDLATRRYLRASLQSARIFGADTRAGAARAPRTSCPAGAAPATLAATHLCRLLADCAALQSVFL